MPLPVSLDDVVIEMDIPVDNFTAYINTGTGELVTVHHDHMMLVEEGEDEEEDDFFVPDWEREAIREAKEVFESDEYVSLPGKDEIHEYGIMQRFAESLEDADVRNDLLEAMRGRGAFRRFRDMLDELGLGDDWFLYRKAALKDIAREFLNKHGIPYREE